MDFKWEVVWPFLIQLYVMSFVVFNPAESNSVPKLDSCWATPNKDQCLIYILDEEMPVDTNIGAYYVEDDDPVITFSFGQVEGERSVALVNQYFKLVKITDKVSYLAIKSKIDYEGLGNTKTFGFYVEMSDGINAPLLKQAMVVIKDINDNAPQFITDSTCNIPESDPVATCTGIEVVDRDTDGTMTVTVSANGVKAGFFKVASVRDTSYPSVDGNKWKVTISLSEALDYETQKLFQLNMEATDKAGHKTTAVLFINVQDVADQPPIFRKLPYDTSKSENLPVGSEIYIVLAEDGDTGIKNPIKYQLKQGNSLNNLFNINEDTGSITLANVLDRESSAIRNSLGVIEITVLAVEQSNSPQSDSLATSEATVRITVIDVNDFKPTFGKTSYTGTLDENTQPGLPISIDPNIYVEDLDVGDNGKLTLTVEKNGQPYDVFVVTPSTIINSGEVLIRVKTPSALDFETVKELDFEVAAKEVNPPHTKVSVPVKVKLTNINDNIPSFEKNLYQVDLPENSARNTKFIQIEAKDLDKGVFGIIIQWMLNCSVQLQLRMCCLICMHIAIAMPSKCLIFLSCH